MLDLLTALTDSSQQRPAVPPHILTFPSCSHLALARPRLAKTLPIAAN